MVKAKKIENDCDVDIMGAIGGLCKSYGDDNLVMVLGNAKGCIKETQLMSTGSLAIDKAVGVMIKGDDGIIRHGIPRGRLVEIYGPESCLAGDSYIPYEVWSKDDKIRRNHKGGTIRRLYERFHDCRTDIEPKQGRHLQNNDSKYYVKSVNDDNCIISNEIFDVVYTGEKECYLVVTNTGHQLISTLEHKYLTPDGFLPLESLEIGSTLFIHNNTRTKTCHSYKARPSIMVKYHPNWPVKKVGDYVYHRGQVSRLCYEASLNNMTNDEYVNFLNKESKEKIDQLNFIPEETHVHHKDENFHNNNFDNLELIDPSEHGRLHSKSKIKNLSFVVTKATIVSIEHVGIKDTYDIKCCYPYNNYIANGIVVHNSGKTTFLNHIMAETQKQGKPVAMIDMEQTWDALYAQKLGVDVSKVVFSQPSYAEQALNVLETLLRTGKFGVICFDSIAALVPKKELEGQMGESHIGVVARLMSQLLRKISSLVNKTDTIVVFTNQIRDKIGVFFGSSETTPGGNAMKFYSSVRIDIRKKGLINDSSGDVIGNRCKIKIVKNKVAAPFKTCEFDILYNIGIDRIGELVDLATDYGIFEKRGSWYSYSGSNIGQGRENSVAVLRENSDLANTVREEIVQRMYNDIYGIDDAEEEASNAEDA